MKREYVEKYEHLYRIFPLFCWRQCCKCKKEFRREWGWKAITGPWYGGLGITRYLCYNCISSRKEANNFFLNSKFENELDYSKFKISSNGILIFPIDESEKED